MDHFRGVTPEERWKNDLLSELRQLNVNLNQLLQGTEQPEQLELITEGLQNKRGRRGRVSKSE